MEYALSDLKSRLTIISLFRLHTSGPVIFSENTILATSMRTIRV